MNRPTPLSVIRYASGLLAIGLLVAMGAWPTVAPWQVYAFVVLGVAWAWVASKADRWWGWGRQYRRQQRAAADAAALRALDVDDE